MAKSIKAYDKEPYDETNSSNPWLLEQHSEHLIVDPKNGEKLTAKYIWSCSGGERVGLVKRVFEYYRQNCSFEDLVKPGLTTAEMSKEYSTLQHYHPNECLTVDGEIKNSNSTGTTILKEYTGDLFYSAKGDAKKSFSCREVYEDDEMFLAVLKNRMGWKTTKEDGSERPYVFAISDKMIVQGMRSSGLAYTVSTFKPAVAKFVFSTFAEKNSNLVFDFSAGWGARALGAGAAGKEYWAIDPLTSGRVNLLMKDFHISGEVIHGCSEEENTYNKIVSNNLKNNFTLAFSSPPYFNLEHYSDSTEQSYVKHNTYEVWLKDYWQKTVCNLQKYVLKKGESKLVLAMVDSVKKYDIAKDMNQICVDNGFVKSKFVPFKTSKSHLSGKKKTGEKEKTTEGVYVFEW